MTADYNTGPAGVLSLAEFIEGEAGSNLLASAENCITEADCKDIGSCLLDEFEQARENGDPYAEDTALRAANYIADQLEGAANEIRAFIRAYFEQSGAIECAEHAITTFCANPTTTNHAALLKAAEILKYHYIPMPIHLARAFRPFIRTRMPANRIDFGNLGSLAEYYIREGMIMREAA